MDRREARDLATTAKQVGTLLVFEYVQNALRIRKYGHVDGDGVFRSMFAPIAPQLLIMGLGADKDRRRLFAQARANARCMHGYKPRLPG